MIGVYDYTVILTYLSLISSVTGIIMAMNGQPFYAVLCLMASGLFDMFDGTVARTKKRSEIEKRFGIQIDSLSDIIGFGVLPVVIGYSIGLTKWYYIPAFCVFVLGALIRLAYFNVNEEEVSKTKLGRSKSFIGLPTTSVALILPIIYFFKNIIGSSFEYVYCVALIIISVLFVAKFNFIKKPSKRLKILFIILGIIEVFLVYQGLRLWKIG